MKHENSFMEMALRKSSTISVFLPILGSKCALIQIIQNFLYEIMGEEKR